MQKKKRVFRAWLYTPQTGRETAVVQEFVLVGWFFFLFKTIPFTVLRNDSSLKQCTWKVMCQEAVVEFLSVLPDESPFCSFIPVLASVCHLPPFLAITIQAICVIIVLLLSAQALVALSHHTFSFPLPVSLSTYTYSILYFLRSALDQRCSCRLLSSSSFWAASSPCPPRKLSLLTKHCLLPARIGCGWSVCLFLNFIVFIKDAFSF